jgi:DNA-directed RNA polymerase subunit M/transcription elongation factor TFIIS
MFWLEFCPRCHGDLYENEDIYGRYVACFQCGHYLTATEEASVRPAWAGPRGNNLRDIGYYRGEYESEESERKATPVAAGT